MTNGEVRAELGSEDLAGPHGEADHPDDVPDQAKTTGLRYWR